MVRRSSPRFVMLVLLAATSFVAGCSSGKDGKQRPDEPDDLDFVTDGSETAAAETDAQLITSSLVSSASSEMLEPRTMGDGARAIYFPPRCLDVATDAATKTATYTFDHCAGPNGLRDVTGVVQATYESTASEVHLELTATQLQVNKATIGWTGKADIRSTDGGAGRKMKWRAKLTGVSGGGRTLDRTTEHSISWRLGEACFDLDGASEGLVSGRKIRTEIERFRRCKRACPDAGGKISVTNVDANATFELLYDGTNRATFVDPDGRTIAVPLLCVP